MEDPVGPVSRLATGAEGFSTVNVAVLWPGQPQTFVDSDDAVKNIILRALSSTAANADPETHAVEVKVLGEGAGSLGIQCGWRKKKK